LHVGVADSVPKIIVRQHLTPVFQLDRSLRVICREGSLEELITQLAGHKLDVVLADEPSTSALRVRTSHQRVSTSESRCAAFRFWPSGLPRISHVLFACRKVRWKAVTKTSGGSRSVIAPVANEKLPAHSAIGPYQ
jgi:hypothetical protein